MLSTAVLIAALRIKCWPADLAAPGLWPAGEGNLSDHKALQHDHHVLSIWLKYC